MSGMKKKDIRFLRRTLFQRICGVSLTPELARDCWTFDGKKIVIELTKIPQLNLPGGSVRLEGGNLPKRVLVVCGQDLQYRAYHNRCTHIGHRRLDLVPGTDTILCCSVSKSTYGVDGRKVFGPAPRDLACFHLEKIADKLVISL